MTTTTKHTAKAVAAILSTMDRTIIGYEYRPRQNGNTSVLRFKVWMINEDGSMNYRTMVTTDSPKEALRAAKGIEYVMSMGLVTR